MSKRVETRRVCEACGQTFGLFHKDCDGPWVEQERTVTPWRTVREFNPSDELFEILRRSLD